MIQFVRRLSEMRSRGHSMRVPRPVLLAGTYALLVAALIALNFYTLVTRRQDYILAEQERLLRIGNAIGRSFEYVLDLTEFAMISVAAETPPDNPTPEKAHDIFKTATRSLPFVREIGMVGLDGNLAISARGYPAHEVHLGNRDYVSYYLKGGRDPVYVSGLNRDATDGVWQISMSRPILDFGGKLIGIQVAAINIDYLRTELLSNSHGVGTKLTGENLNDFSITLVDREMRVVARDPSTEADIGKSLAQSDLFRGLVSSNADQFAGAFLGILTGIPRIGAAQWLAHKRFIIGVSQPTDAVLSDWRKEAAVTFNLSLIFFAGMTFVVVQTARNERRQAEYVARLAATNTELETQTKRAEASAIAKGNFLANMSHEIRTPLTGIIGYSGLALEDDKMSEETRRYVKLVHSASNNLRTVIDDILDLAKIETGKVEIASISFSVHELVDNCASLADPIAKVKGLELRKRLDPAIPHWVMGDAIRTQQIMLNLINNAIKFTEKGFVELCATFEGMADDKAVIWIGVRDSGIGIAADKLPLLFKRFQQADETITRRFGGTGLGLAISKALVAAMRGEIGAESTLGKGSTFWLKLSLPVAAGPPEERVEPAPGAAERPLKILVVDDSAMNADLAQTLLSRLGHDVDTASDGASAVHACATKRYDIVFMDVQMPGMDGMEAAREIRALDAHTANMPIIAMTANVMPDQVAQYRAAGMNDHLGKPIDHNRLRAILAHVARPGKPAPAAPAPAAEPDKPAFDRAVFDDLRGALGPERTLHHLHNFSDQLALDIWHGDADHNEIMTRAHKIIAAAGQFGFMRLSAGAYDLETAIRGDGDVDAALQTFNDARTAAAPVLLRLIAEEPAPAQPAKAASGAA